LKILEQKNKFSRREEKTPGLGWSSARLAPAKGDKGGELSRLNHNERPEKGVAKEDLIKAIEGVRKGEKRNSGAKDT